MNCLYESLNIISYLFRENFDCNEMDFVCCHITNQWAAGTGSSPLISQLLPSSILPLLCTILHIHLVTMTTQSFVICSKESCELSLAQRPAAWAYLKRVTQGCKCNLPESLTSKIPNLTVAWEHVMSSLVVVMAVILSGWIWFVLALDSHESGYRTGRTFYFTRAGLDKTLKITSLPYNYCQALGNGKGIRSWIFPFI